MNEQLLADAVDFANRTLAADDAPNPERRLARYVLALAEQLEATRPVVQPEPEVQLNVSCKICGHRALFVYTPGAVMDQHDHAVSRAGAEHHAPVLEQANGHILVLTPGTVREMQRPSGEATERDATGPNDPYGK